MTHNIIYHIFRTGVVNCRRDVLNGMITGDQADSAFDAIENQLKLDFNPEAVQKAYEQFESDMRLMDWLQWFEGSGIIGKCIAFTMVMASTQEKIDRMNHFWELLVQIEQKHIVSIENLDPDENN